MVEPDETVIEIDRAVLEVDGERMIVKDVTIDIDLERRYLHNPEESVKPTESIGTDTTIEASRAGSSNSE